MIAEVLVGVVLLSLGIWLCLAPASDLLAAVVGWFHRSRERPTDYQLEPLLFLVPAHNEELLIGRCVDSLTSMAYSEAKRTIAVIADNCTDRTAVIAAERGARVLERSSATERGKGHAIGWALREIDLTDFAAVIVVDADTVVEPDYASAIASWGPLRERALQTYDGLSNEFENALTRMAGLLTRNRYGTSLRLKARAGLNCPMTGDGIVLGTGVLERFPWNVSTITEGWELYTKLTVHGQPIGYAAEARLYAQETSSLDTSRTQRQRWASGRLAVLRAYLPAILSRSGIGLLQRLDLVAELSNLGPVTHCALGFGAAMFALGVHPPGAVALIVLLISPIVHQAAMSLISLWHHPQPMRTLAAFARLPRYALWRVGVAIGVLARKEQATWVRTERH